MEVSVMRVKVFSFFITIFIVIPFSSCAIEKDENTTLQGEIIGNGGSNMQNSDLEEVYLHYDWPGYSNLDELYQRATDIVRVEIISSGWCEEIDINLDTNAKPVLMLYTLHEVRVIESYKGTRKENEILIIRQIGGETDRKRIMPDHRIPFSLGDDLVIFSRKYIKTDHSGLLSPWDAVYHIETENGTRISSDTRASDNHKLVPVDERGYLSFTIGELRNYRAKEE
jgi:hypothetical protein